MKSRDPPLIAFLIASSVGLGEDWSDEGIFDVDETKNRWNGFRKTRKNVRNLEMADLGRAVIIQTKQQALLPELGALAGALDDVSYDAESSLCISESAEPRCKDETIPYKLLIMDAQETFRR